MKRLLIALSILVGIVLGTQAVEAQSKPKQPKHKFTVVTATLADTLRQELNARLDANPNAPATLNDFAIMYNLIKREMYDNFAQVPSSNKHGYLAKQEQAMESFKTQVSSQYSTAVSAMQNLVAIVSEMKTTQNRLTSVVAAEEGIDIDPEDLPADGQEALAQLRIDLAAWRAANPPPVATQAPTSTQPNY